MLWVPLRRLKQRRYDKYNLRSLFFHIYFEGHPDGEQLAKKLWSVIDNNEAGYRGTLFVLDGLDEVSDLLDSAHEASGFLVDLLNHPNVIITSRPHVKLPPSVKTDLELETIGFYPDQVNAYLRKTFANQEGGQEKVARIQKFLQRHPLIQGLVRIPIQLDAVCFAWDDFQDTPTLETMTAVYKAIELSLWKKDIMNLDKKVGGLPLTQHVVQNSIPEGIEELADVEIVLLEAFAFAGLYSDVIDFEPIHRSQIPPHIQSTEKSLHKQTLQEMTLPKLSFLRTSDPSSKPGKRNYHFLHLTFQEYFAARYFVRRWKTSQSLRCIDLHSGRHQDAKPAAFLQTHKYSSRYDIFWRFVTGLLSTEERGEGHTEEAGDLIRFFKMVETDPVDLVGPAHQRIIMHCLSEVVSKDEKSAFGQLRATLEKKIVWWLLFESKSYSDTYLAREAEFPKTALLVALEQGSSLQRVTIIRALSHRAYLPSSTLDTLATLLRDDNWTVRSAAAEALGNQKDLPSSTLDTLITLLRDDDSIVRYYAAEALGNQCNRICESLGFLDARKSAAAAMATPITICESLLRVLYCILVWRGFREPLSLSITKSNFDGGGSGGDCTLVLDLPTGRQVRVFQSRQDLGHFRNALEDTRQVLDSDGKLW